MNNDKRKSDSMGSIPLISAAVARARVRRLERAVSRVRVRTTEALGRLSSECAQQTAIQATVLAAREALRGLALEAQEPLSRRIAEAETRLEAIRPLCALPRPEAAPPGAELSGGVGPSAGPSLKPPASNEPLTVEELHRANETLKGEFEAKNRKLEGESR